MGYKHVLLDHVLAKRFDIDEAECRSLIDAIDKRKRMVRTAPSIVSLLAAFGWMILFGRGGDALEETAWDIFGFFHDAGFLGFMMALLLGFGVAFALAVVSGLTLRRFLLRRQFRYHLFTPACFWCGYPAGMPNTVACETLDAMCAVCGAHCATWVGEDDQGNRDYTLDCLDKDGQRYVVHSNDLLEAVCELAVLLGVDFSDI